MTDEPQLPLQPDPGPDPHPGSPDEPPPAGRPLPVPPQSPSPAHREWAPGVRSLHPGDRGTELDPEQGPGKGCFWFQVIVLALFIVLIPIGVGLDWPSELLALLVFVVIGLVLLTGQTVVFLLRLVAADRRAHGKGTPWRGSRKKAGEGEDDVHPDAAGGTDSGATSPDRPDATAEATGAGAAGGSDAPPDGAPDQAETPAPEDAGPGVRQ